MYPRLPCVFHPSQTLTNFCTQPNCLLPLCPTCIKIHTAEHTSQRTTPSYEQINHLLGEVAGDLRCCCRKMEEDLERVNRLEEERQNWKRKIMEELMGVRREVDRVVEEWWQGVCKSVEDGWARGGGCESKAAEFGRVLGKQVTAFQRLEESIYSAKAMRTVIKFKSEDIMNKSDLSHSIVTQFLEKCRQRDLSITINPDFKSKLKSVLTSTCTIKPPPKTSNIDLQPLDITNSLQIPTSQRKTQPNSPSCQYRSRRTQSQQKRHRGIRLVGLQNQLQMLDQTKKAMLNKTARLGVPLLTQKENLSEYRSIKAFNYMADKLR